VPTTLAAASAAHSFNADYYVAIVTVLPVLMIAVEVLTNFNKSVPVQTVKKWPLFFQFWLVFFYLFSPIIAAAGVVVGVLALMYRDTGAAYRWTAFSCLVSVLGFLAISSTVYLLAFDTAQTRREKAEAQAQNRPS
jgi:phosphatidylglycerophosphate synthase